MPTNKVVTEDTARRLAVALIDSHRLQREFDLEDTTAYDLPQVVNALEDLGCKVDWDEGKRFATVQIP